MGGIKFITFDAPQKSPRLLKYLFFFLWGRIPGQSGRYTRAMHDASTLLHTTTSYFAYYPFNFRRQFSLGCFIIVSAFLPLAANNAK